jgi:hypothetical protein
VSIGKLKHIVACCIVEIIQIDKKAGIAIVSKDDIIKFLTIVEKCDPWRVLNNGWLNGHALLGTEDAYPFIERRKRVKRRRSESMLLIVALYG